MMKMNYFSERMVSMKTFVSYIVEQSKTDLYSPTTYSWVRGYNDSQYNEAVEFARTIPGKVRIIRIEQLEVFFKSNDKLECDDCGVLQFSSVVSCIDCKNGSNFLKT